MSTVNRFPHGAAMTALLVLALSGCAGKNGASTDPWEGYNRAMFSFNEGVDRALIKPVAKGYEWLVPTPVNTVITNFFNNIGDVLVSANNLLQGKVKDAGSDLGRVVLNSSLGIGGLVDVATDMGMEKHDEDFGQTFARWGVGDGPYFVLPFLGPSTVRDAFGQVADWQTDPLAFVNPDVVHYSLVGLRQIDTRADLFPAEKMFEAGAIDKYIYLRDAYLQHRRYLIHDGRPPREEEE
jgi:phospholipid-binding lipoprotein MlaA